MVSAIDIEKYKLEGVKPEYAAFIVEIIEEKIKDRCYAHWKTPPKPSTVARAQCLQFSERLQKKFPHLKLEKGWYVTTDGEDDYPTEHWWTVDVDGTIVDPSKIQFHDQNGRYSPYDDHEFKAMIGRCPNCGNDIYEGEGSGGLCSDECESSYAAYIEHEVKMWR